MNRINYARYASIVLDVSIDKTLDYGVPLELEDRVKVGMRVEVLLRGQRRTGYIMALKDTSDVAKAAPIVSILSDQVEITTDLLQLALWLSRYYRANLYKVIKSLIPSAVRKGTSHKEQLYVMRGKTREELRSACVALRGKNPAQAEVLDIMLQVSKGILLTELLDQCGGKRSSVDTLAKKGFVVLDNVRVDRSPLQGEEYFHVKPKPLNDQQKAAYEKMERALDEKRFETHLLYGVTGSGKTEVYLAAIDAALQRGRGAIMLVPEISLTIQTIERFRSRFSGNIALLHHRLSVGERYDEWQRLLRGEAKIAIGARSAIFSPVKDLGVIIVDEEHDNAYKQGDEMPCYHARNVAVMRGKITDSVVILGSATPSLESYHNAKRGKYVLSELSSRADSATIPNVTLIDMKKEMQKAKGFTNFSDPLIEGIKKRVALGEQTILFLNRRGYHTTMLCKGCNHVVKCKHCEIALTFHLNENNLTCHLCGYLIAPPKMCPSCRCDSTMKYKGVGTELVEKSLLALMPDVRTIRLDADTTKHKGSHQQLLRSFATGKADVLIGTQMVAKGLHFPQVTLVGVLNGDAGLHLPDFRASETTFQLITQVAGRSGRGRQAGEVIVQTNLMDNSTIQCAVKQDYQEFYGQEISIRQAFRYPPFLQMVKVTFSGKDQKQVYHCSEKMRDLLVRELPADFEVFGTTAAGHAKVKDKYYFQFLIKGPHIAVINKALDSVETNCRLPSNVRMFIDIDPTSTFF